MAPRKGPTRKRPARREWTGSDVRELKTLAKQKISAKLIANRLKRTEGAVRQKAFAIGLSLSLRRRAGAKRRKVS
jgi:hypothetical protein